MTKALTVFFISIILLACEQGTQQIDNDKVRLDNVCDSFMNLFSQGKTHDALQILKANTSMTSASIDTLQLTIDKQINDYFPAYGKVLSYEFITERKIKDFIIRRFYILKFDKYYLKFDFTIYKASTTWTITNFKYNEELIELLN